MAEGSAAVLDDGRGVRDGALRCSGRGTDRAVGDSSPTSISRSRRLSRSTPRAPRSRLLDHRDSPRPGADARECAEARVGREPTSSGRRIRSRTGATRTAGRTSTSAGCPTRAARPRLRVDRRHPLDTGAGREGRWAGTGRPSAACTSARSRREPRRSRRTLSHLDELEAEAIHIMREVAAERERPVLLFSGGKDSIVMLRLAEKAFRPAQVPVPGHARRHGSQLPRGDRVPRPPRRRAR